MRELRNEIAVLQKRNIELEDENKYLKGEIKGMRHRSNQDFPSTMDKINMEMERRFSGWRFYRDKFLIPSLQIVHHGLLLGLLAGLGYLIMLGKAP